MLNVKKPNIKSFIIILFLVITLLIVVNAIFIPNTIGYANNGDFERVMYGAGLENVQRTHADQYFNYVNTQYVITNLLLPNGVPYSISQFVIIKAAMLLDFLCSFDGYFDIRFLGATYLFLFLGLLYLILKKASKYSLIVTVVTGLAFVFIFTDISYLAYFNTFFGEVTMLLTLLFTVILGLKLATEPGNRKVLIFFAIAAFLFVNSKAQNLPAGILISIFLIRMFFVVKDRKWHKACLIAAASIFVLTTVTYIVYPSDFKHINMYQSVFYGVLKDSPDVSADLKQLGLPDEFKKLAGTNFFEPIDTDRNSQYMLDNFYAKSGPFQNTLFYMKNPQRFFQKLEISAEKSFYSRPTYLGNYTKQENPAPKAQYPNLSYWTDLKASLIPNNLLTLIIFFATYLLLLIIFYIKNKSQRIALEFFGLIWLIAIFQFCLPIIADGEADLGKHLYSFSLCFDILILWVIAFLSYQVVSFIKRKKLLQKP